MHNKDEPKPLTFKNIKDEENERIDEYLLLR